MHHIPETGDDNSFGAAPADMLAGDIDGDVTLKPGEAPEKVHHHLTADARLKALAFTKDLQVRPRHDLCRLATYHI